MKKSPTIHHSNLLVGVFSANHLFSFLIYSLVFYLLSTLVFPVFIFWVIILPVLLIGFIVMWLQDLEFFKRREVIVKRCKISISGHLFDADRLILIFNSSLFVLMDSEEGYILNGRSDSLLFKELYDSEIEKDRNSTLIFRYIYTKIYFLPLIRFLMLFSN